MKNPLQYVDDTIMYGVNKGVHAWNWTTGRTKADLANEMLTVASVSESLGAIFMGRIAPIAFIMVAPSMLFFSHFAQKINTKQEKLEEEALENEALSLDAKLNNNSHKANAYLWLSGSTFQYAPKETDYNANLGLGTGHALRSLSHFVMRADYLPPRKSCVRRGLESLAKMYKESKLKPAIEPIPISYYQSE